jgi:hypothetical protein
MFLLFGPADPVKFQSFVLLLLSLPFFSARFDDFGVTCMHVYYNQAIPHVMQKN